MSSVSSAIGAPIAAALYRSHVNLGPSNWNSANCQGRANLLEDHLEHLSTQAFALALFLDHCKPAPVRIVFGLGQATASVR